MPDDKKAAEPIVAPNPAEEVVSPPQPVRKTRNRTKRPEAEPFYATQEQWAEFRNLSYVKGGGVGTDAYATGMSYVDSARKATLEKFKAYYDSEDRSRRDINHATLCRMIGVDPGAMRNRLKEGSFVMPFASLSALCTSVLGVSCHDYLFGYKGRVPLPGQLAAIVDLLGKNAPLRKANRMYARFEGKGKPYKKVDYVMEQMSNLYAEAGRENALRPEPSIRTRDRFGTASDKYSDDSIATILIRDRLKELAEIRGVDMMRLMDKEPVFSPIPSGKEKNSLFLWSIAPPDIKIPLSVFDLTDEQVQDPEVLSKLHPRGLRPLMYYAQWLNVAIDYFLETDYSPFVEMGWEYIDSSGKNTWVKAQESPVIHAFVSRYLRMNKEYQDKIAAIALDALMFG